MEKQKNNLIVILCGGSGPRLWPLSKTIFPKQFLKIFSQNSILKETVLRSQKIVGRNQVFIVSNQKYSKNLKNDLKNLVPSTNIFLEPEKKNTTAAFIFSLSQIAIKYPQAVVSFMPSDHYISHLKYFSQDLFKCFKIATDTDNLVAIGIDPSYPNPAYGYLLPGTKKDDFYFIKSFLEKPDTKKATNLIKNHALWNSGMYTAKMSVFQKLFYTHQKSDYLLIQKLFDNPSSQPIIKKFYELFPSISFDKAISEKTKKLIFFKASFEWSDVGQWKSIFNILPKDKEYIAHIDKSTLYLSHLSQNCLISSTNPSKLIGLVGVNNLAIIDTPDGLLICDLNHSFFVRDLVSKMVSNPKLKSHFAPDEK